MNAALSISQIQRMEEYAIKTVGIPSVVLMDRAGEAVARSVLRSFRREKDLKVTVVCGTGNNGGDGLVAARYLWAAGIKVNVIVVGSIGDLKADPAVFFKIVKSFGIPVNFIKSVDQEFLGLIGSSKVLVDALFGIGLNRPLTGLYEQLVNAINQS